MQFNPEQFMQAVITETMDTKMILCPTGEYPAIIDDIKPKGGEIQKGDRIGQMWAGMDVFWEILDPSVNSITLREKTRVKQTVFFDLTEEGMLDLSKGKNIDLGRLRDSVGLNRPGESFSFPMLISRQARVKVSHRADKQEVGKFYDEVSGVAKL